MTFTNQVTATPDPPSTGVHNPIHDAEGADAGAGAILESVRAANGDTERVR